MKRFVRLLLAICFLLGADYAIDKALKHGLDQGMGLNEHSKVLIVGHSHLMMGLDKEMMEKALHCKVTKHTRSGVGVEERYLMTKMFLDSPYSDSLKVVVIGVDPFLFNSSGISENCYTLFYPWMDDSFVDDYIQKFTDDVTYYAHKIFRTSRYSDDLMKQSVRGWKNDDRNYKTTVFTDSLSEANREKWGRPILWNAESARCLENTIKLCTDRGIQVVLLQTPILRVLTDLQPDGYKGMLDYYQKLGMNNPLISS